MRPLPPPHKRTFHVVRVILGSVLVVAGVAKGTNMAEFLNDFVSSRSWYSSHFGMRVLALHLPGIEIAVGLYLILDRNRFLTGCLSFGLFFAFLAVALGTLSTGSVSSCGCFQSRQIDSLGPGFLVGKNALLFALASAHLYLAAVSCEKGGEGA